MSGMTLFFTVVHVLLSVFMIFVILLQPGKDAGMGAAFGGGAATSAFGGRGAVTFLSKLTAICAGLFFLTSLGLSFVGMNASVASKIAGKQTTTAPAPQAVEQQPGGAAAAGSSPATPGTGAAPSDGPLPLEVPPAPAPATPTPSEPNAPAAPAPAPAQ